jgi:GABA permease
VYLAIAVSQVRWRRKHEQAGDLAPSSLPMWGFPWLSYAAIGGMTLVLITTAATPSLSAEFWASTVSISVVLVAYFVRRSRKTR